MLITLIIIAWLVFGMMAAFTLFYTKDQNHQVLGVTLSDAHVQAPEVQDMLSRYKQVCIFIFLLSGGLSLLLLLPALGFYFEFFLLMLVLANLFFNWFVIHKYQQKLQALKREKGWIYQQSRIITVDMNVVREKGKAGVSSVWVWLFWLLSFLPMVYLLFSPATRELYPIGFSLIGPFCQLCMVFLYYRMLRSHTPALSENTEVNKACARILERIRTTGTTLSALSILVFWILFNLFILHLRNILMIALLLIILVIALFITAFWQQKKIKAAENYFFGPEIKDDSHLFEQEGIYKWGFYYNPDDPKLFVPKRIASMGWTINIAHPAGKLMAFGILVLVLAVLIPEGTRTNGYGGANKSFGHFSLDGYGKCMLYIYHKGGGYIVLKLTGDNPAYVIVNGKTPEDTEALYRSIEEWVGK